MTRRETYEAKTEELLQPLVDAHGFELVDVEYVKEAGNWYLRAYIDKPGGIAVDDLEVSSPGLGRPLKKDKDFQRSIGKEIEVRTFRAIDKQKEFTGILKEFNKDSFTIVIEDNEMTFQRSETALVRLAFDF